MLPPGLRPWAVGVVIIAAILVAWRWSAKKGDSSPITNSPTFNPTFNPTIQLTPPSALSPGPPPQPSELASAVAPPTQSVQVPTGAAHRQAPINPPPVVPMPPAPTRPPPATTSYTVNGDNHGNVGPNGTVINGVPVPTGSAR